MFSPRGFRPRSSSLAPVLAVTGAALFMIVLDNLIVLATLPSIQRDLDASLADAQWVVDAYVLAFAVGILPGAALGERYGRRRVFGAALAGFSAASAAAALAPSIGALTAARALQGSAGALLMPLTLTLLTSAVPAHRRGSALGIWSSIAGAGVALGPIAGGLLAAALSWHWIFWVNVPVGLAALLAAPRVLAESRGAPDPIDVRGVVMVGVGFLGVVWATVRGNDAGWTAPPTIVAYLIGALALAGFVGWQRRAPYPMLPPRLFSERRFSAANAAGFALQFAMFAAFLMIAQFLSHVDHSGPIMVGVWTLPWTIMPLLVSPAAGRLGQRAGPTGPATAGLALIACGVLLLATMLSPSTPAALLAPGLALIGVGIGFVLPNLTAVVVSSTPAEDVGRGSAILSAARQLGAVTGVAAAVAVFGIAGSTADRAQETAGIRAALLVAGAVAFAGAALASLAHRRAPSAQPCIA